MPHPISILSRGRWGDGVGGWGYEVGWMQCGMRRGDAFLLLCMCIMYYYPLYGFGAQPTKSMLGPEGELFLNGPTFDFRRWTVAGRARVDVAGVDPAAVTLVSFIIVRRSSCWAIAACHALSVIVPLAAMDGIRRFNSHCRLSFIVLRRPLLPPLVPPIYRRRRGPSP